MKQSIEQIKRQNRSQRFDAVDWIGVDLDGTLAFYDRWRGPNHIGKPIDPMVTRVKQWLADGKNVRIFTARASHPGCNFKVIEEWCEVHLGTVLPITATKDYRCLQIWDDRAIQVEVNTGRRMDGIPDDETVTP